MSRQPRLDLADVPQHVVQRGNDRQPCFFASTDYSRYLTNLREAALRYDVAIHAYVLMTNHVHLLATPTEVGGVSRMMQFLGRQYVSYVNVNYRRTGTLWEGRYKSCLVDSDQYLLACYRYIELNPVRAMMVARPEEYAWSSYRSNALGSCDSLLHPHRQYLALAANADDRRAAYRMLFDEVLDDQRVSDIRAYLQQQRAWGSERFQSIVAAQLGRCAQTRPARRPRKSEQMI
jgi:putative transposase